MKCSMFRSIPFCAVLLGLVCFVGSVPGQQVIFEFEGTVSSAGGTYLPGEFNVGDSVSGSFSFDSGVSGTYSSISGFYNQSSVQFFNTTIAGVDFSRVGGYRVQTTDHPVGFDRLEVSAFGAEAPGLSLPTGFWFSSMKLDLLDSSGTTFVNLDLPSTIDLSDWTSAQLNLQLANGNIVDGELFADITSLTQIQFVNDAPNADPGSDQSIRVGETVLVDGSGSFDDNTAQALLVYDWSFFSKPAGSTALFDDINSVMPSFVVDVAGTYTVQLIVTDEQGAASDPAFVEISSDNLAPTAVAMVPSNLVVINNALQLDGSSSSDPEMDALTYSWIITAAPATSTAVLGDAGTATPTLTPDVEGVYEVALTVSDFVGPGAPVSVEITATTASGLAEIFILDACDQASALTAGQVTTKGNQNAFCKHLANAIGDLQGGLVDEAIEKLNKAVGRTDGCTLRGSPDGNGPGRDWIIDCNAQTAIYELLNLAIDALEV